MRRTLAVVFTLALVAPVWAQEPAEEEDEEGRRGPTRQIRVLNHPYEIASFYRSSQGPNYFGYQPPASDLTGRYPIASFYRSRQSAPFGPYYGGAPFWGSGYGARRPGLVIGYRRSIGENGDLFLFAPTFLAPIGPLAGVFFDR